MVKVDGSIYQAGPSHTPLWVPSYYIDIYLVSNADYAQFVAATGHQPPQHWENGVGATTAVDCYQSGTSPYGVYDMCGNVWEWLDTQSTPGRRELKGGAWTSQFDRAVPSQFNDANETMCDDDTGFRCAAPAEDLERLLHGTD